MKIDVFNASSEEDETSWPSYLAGVLLFLVLLLSWSLGRTLARSPALGGPVSSAGRE